MKNIAISFLTDKQLKIMQILWDSCTPMTILEISPKVDLSISSLSNMMNLLIEKGFIEIVGIEKVNGHYPRKFAPTYSKEEYAAKLLKALDFNKKSFSKIAVALFKEFSEKYEEDSVQQLKSILNCFNENKGIKES